MLGPDGVGGVLSGTECDSAEVITRVITIKDKDGFKTYQIVSSPETLNLPENFGEQEIDRKIVFSALINKSFIPQGELLINCTSQHGHFKNYETKDNGEISKRMIFWDTQDSELKFEDYSYEIKGNEYTASASVFKRLDTSNLNEFNIRKIELRQINTETPGYSVQELAKSSNLYGYSSSNGGDPALIHFHSAPLVCRESNDFNFSFDSTTDNSSSGTGCETLPNRSGDQLAIGNFGLSANKLFRAQFTGFFSPETP